MSTSEICPPTKIQEIVSNAYLLNGHISKTIDTSYMCLQCHGYITSCNLPSTYQPFHLPAYIFTSSILIYIPNCQPGNLHTYYILTNCPTHQPNALVISLTVSQSVSLFACLAYPTDNEQKYRKNTLVVRKASNHIHCIKLAYLLIYPINYPPTYLLIFLSVYLHYNTYLPTYLPTSHRYTLTYLLNYPLSSLPAFTSTQNTQTQTHLPTTLLTHKFTHPLTDPTNQQPPTPLLCGGADWVGASAAPPPPPKKKIPPIFCIVSFIKCSIYVHAYQALVHFST